MKLGLIGLVVAALLSLAACSSGSHTGKVLASVTTTTAPTATSLEASAPSPTSLVAETTTTTGETRNARSTTTAVHPTATQPVVTTTAPASGTVVSSTNNASYGAILVDGSGRTLYLFTPDDGTSSPQCTGSCAQTWPPLKASGTPRATGGARQSLLGVEAGQVTYNGHPLYLYAGDSKAGQTNGEGVGGIWYVVSTAGNPVLH